ncbi:MAG: pitrilysin family protein [Phycisphaerales bacterium]|nr:pitrilysin family protein [Phycisphaerales bacterium]
MTLKRSIAPSIQDPVVFDYNLPPINIQKLDNGTPLYWLNAGVQDVVEINWVFPAGIWYEEKQAVAQATAGQLKNGTLTRTAKQINEALEFYGASLKVSAGNDYTTLTLDTLTKHLPSLLPIVLDVILNPVFPEDELELYKQNAIQRLLVSLCECDFVANQQIDAALFGPHHPYGRYTQKQNIELLNASDLKNFHQLHYRFARTQLFMAGKVGDAEVRLMNSFFGLVAHDISEYKNTTSFETLAYPDKQIRINNDPNGVQGAIRIGRKFITRSHPDFAGVVVLNTLFGGYFGSRLMSNIREEKGYTYGIYSSIGAFTHDASLTIHTEVGSHVIDDALREIYKEMDLLCSEKADEEELLLVKNYLLGNILGDLDGPFSIMQRWRSMILNGFGIERFHQNIQTYKNITAEELHRLAQQYFDKKDFTEIVVV